jgi:RHS repeat-associated protein
MTSSLAASLFNSPTVGWILRSSNNPRRVRVSRRSGVALKTFLSLVFLLLVGCGSSFSQTIGYQPFQVRDAHQYDSINVSDLGVFIDIPAVNKQGVTPFSLHLVQETDIAQQGSAPLPLTGVLTNQAVAVFQPHIGCPVTGTGFSAYYFIIIDSAQTGHLVYAQGSTLSNPIDFTVCAPPGGSSSGTGITLDSSGYTIVATVNATTQVISCTITDLHGNTTTDTIADYAYLYQNADTIYISDPNGNTITESIAITRGSQETITYKDQTGLSLMTITAPYWTETGNCQVNNPPDCAFGYYPTSYVYPDTEGHPQPYTVNYELMCWADMTTGSTVSGYGPFPTSLGLPDGSSFSFTYNEQNVSCNGPAPWTTGQLTSMTTPSGEVITYSNVASAQYGYTPELQRTGQDGTWTYNIIANALQSPSHRGAAMVHSPHNDEVYYTFVASSTPTVLPTTKTSYAGDAYHGNGTALSTQYLCYNGYNTSPSGCANATVVAAPIVQRDSYTYVAGGAAPSLSETTYDTYERELEDKEYDFGATWPPSGTPLSDTLYQYGTYNSHTGQCSPISTTINDRVCTKQVKGNATLSAQTNNSFDAHGNLLSTSSLVNETAQTYLTKTATYNSNGMRATMTDVNGAVTHYYYNGAGGCNNGLLTSTTLPVNSLSTSQEWNCYGAVITSATDENGQLTGYGYLSPTEQPDPLLRVRSIIDPLNNATWTTYTIASSTGPATVENSLSFGSSTVDVLTSLDSVGRLHLSQTKQGLGTANFDTVIQNYDSNSRPYSVGLPCVSTASAVCTPPPAETSVTYDPLNRPLIVQDAGSGILTYQYSANDVLATLGPPPSGENAKQRQLEYDGTGRLTSVCEILGTGGSSCGQTTSASGYKTSYAYSVPKAGGSQMVVTQGSQTRTYVYDGLGRLLSESNPESGNVAYTYDIDTTCGMYKGDLVKRVDALNNVTCYKYDALHRITAVTYPSGPYASSTASKSFVYDSTTFTCPNGPNGTNEPNVKGRLAEAFTGPSTAKITDLGYCYSPRGEVTDVYESTLHSGGYYHTTSAYWPNGVLKSFTLVNSALPTINYGVDGEGRQNTANGLTSTTYNPAGQVTGLTVGYGSSNVMSFGYDPNTLRTTSYSVGLTGGTFTGSLNWNPNGTLGSQQTIDPFNSTDNQTCNYTHDDLVRIASVNCLSGSTNIWNQDFTYDPFGNITKTVPTGGTGFSWQPSYSSTTNRYTAIPGVTPIYDSNGNLTYDSFNHYTWDAENSPVSVQDGSDTFTVIHDALGQLVEYELNGSGYVEYVYLGSSRIQMVGQTLNSAMVPLPGGAIEEFISSGSASAFWLPDHLGSGRLSFSYNGGNFSGSGAYAPFGERYAASTDGYEDIFTGQPAFINGVEPAMYDFPAREYHSTQGRWISPDPAGISAVNPANPQSWNRYVYASNNPLSDTDPTGEDDSENGGSSSSDCPSGVDACIDLGWSGSTSTMSWSLSNPSGSLGSGSTWYDPWMGHSMAQAVFTNPVLTQAAQTMNAVTAVYGVGLAAGGAVAVGSAVGAGSLATGLYHAAVGHYLIYGVPTIAAIGCAELCTGLSPSVSSTVNFAKAEGQPFVSRSLPALEINSSKYPDLAENILNAQRAGWPNVLTHGGDQVANRAAALKGIPQIPGLTRDEYPFASSVEGGAGSWVGHIPGIQQSAQGALITNFARANNITAGSQYKVVVLP